VRIAVQSPAGSAEHRHLRERLTEQGDHEQHPHQAAGELRPDFRA